MERLLPPDKVEGEYFCRGVIDRGWRYKDPTTGEKKFFRDKKGQYCIGLLNKHGAPLKIGEPLHILWIPICKEEEKSSYLNAVLTLKLELIKEATMKHRTYNDLGKYISESLGVNCSADTLFEAATFIRSDTQQLSVLAAIFNELKNIRTELRKQRTTKPKPTIAAKESPSHPVADGMLEWMKAGAYIPSAADSQWADMPIDEMDREQLSVRATNVLRRSGIKYRSQITSKQLTDTRGCGEAVLYELLCWAQL